MKFLRDGILDLDRLDEVIEGLALLLPLLRRIYQDDTRLHAVGVNTFDVAFEVLELFHSLQTKN